MEYLESLLVAHWWLWLVIVVVSVVLGWLLEPRVTARKVLVMLCAMELITGIGLLLNVVKKMGDPVGLIFTTHLVFGVFFVAVAVTRTLKRPVDA